MALPDSRLAYEDCFKILERALESTKGIRVRFADRGTALRFRTRLHYARNIDRSDNRQNFERGHPMFGKSLYDVITVRDPVKDDKTIWLYIEKLDGNELEIEELEDVQQERTLGGNGSAEGEGEGSGGSEEAVEEEPEAVHSAVRRI